MRVKVLKEGVSQREGDKIVPREVGSFIEVSESAYRHLGPDGRGMIGPTESAPEPPEQEE